MSAIPKLICVFVIIYYSIKICLGIRLYQVTPPVDHAEGPSWDSRKGILYFVDIHAGNVYSYVQATGRVRYIHLDGDVTPVIPSKYDPNLLILGVNRTLVAVDWNGKSKCYRSKPLTTVSKQFPTSRFNDGKADMQGRLWIGTMGFEDSKGVAPNQGLLYKFTRNNLKNPAVMIAPVNISNGLAWNKDNDIFYYIDTPTRKIVAYDFDEENGEISNRRVAFDLQLYPQIKGSPDGMTIDRDDNLWVALYGGGAVIKVDPRKGHLLLTVAIPAKAVTSTMWGGPKMDILYITTSRFSLTPQQRKEQPYAGSVFAMTDLGTSAPEVFDADIVDTVL